MPPPFDAGTRGLLCASAGHDERATTQAAIAAISVRFQPAHLLVDPELMNMTTSGSCDPSSITAVTQVRAPPTPTLPQPSSHGRYHPQKFVVNQRSCGTMGLPLAPVGQIACDFPADR